ncbi:hypothetical membrane protein [Halopelagius inordinatus]|uniref:Hypothetical membrane protein n=1 Tax=Halopelagius inordinatus TaxID=553467 RepID=A0A1I2NNS9_9EURY|nr:DUF998 domain-containing protein [Halopelagius inordinatus]SFG04409.1 hypothetical membrane protein [Halopelagius inordinatus]
MIRLAPVSRRTARALGAVGSLVALGGVVLATALSPTFSWAASALSDLGVRPPTAPVFNGSLAVGGAVAVGYALPLGRQSRLVAACYAVAVASLSLVGVFPAGTALHVPVAVSFFVASTATMTADGVARRDSRSGRLALLLAAGHVVSWGLWLRGVRLGPGLAVPEFAGAVAFAAWVVALSSPAPLRSAFDADASAQV